MKRLCAALLLISLPFLLSGCKRPAQRYSTTFFGMFDSYGTITGYCEDERTFQAAAEKAVEVLRRLHKVFDGYAEYEGLTNLYTLNTTAANGPVVVPDELYDLLKWCKGEADAYGGRVNVAMGAVLKLWHDCREDMLADPESAALPSEEALAEAAKHCNMDDLILNADDKSVYFADPELRLDLGAVAKGWAADAAASVLRASGMPSFLVNLGGNVIAGEKPLDGRDAWNISVMDPGGADESGSDRLALVKAANLSIVTSGDYQRYFLLNGERYHHIIDPDTLQPSRYLRATTVAAASSALSDLLSTTLMLTPYEKGRDLIESLEGVEALWVLNDGSIEMTDGMQTLLAKEAA